MVRTGLREGDDVSSDETLLGVAVPIVFKPWTAFPGANPCTADAPGGLKLRHGAPLLVCTREEGHDGEHAVGVDGTVHWPRQDDSRE